MNAASVFLVAQQFAADWFLEICIALALVVGYVIGGEVMSIRMTRLITRRGNTS